MIYIDYNATTPVDPRVNQAAQIWNAEKFGNASSGDHAWGWESFEAVEDSRRALADFVNSAPREITLTSGATESVNLALKGFAFAKDLGKKDIVTSTAEHEAVLGACRQIERLTSVRAKYLPVDRVGRIDLTALANIIEPGHATLVALIHANNENGTINPIREAAKIAHDAGALFFTDATQALGKIPVDVRADGVDMAAFSAHKIYGPKGVGALFIRGGEPNIELEPLIVGGGQERGLRSGTLNVPGIVGFGEACRIAQMEMAEEAERVRRLRDRLESALLAQLPNLRINGDLNNRLPNTSNITFSGVDARTLIRHMNFVAVSTRSACSSGSPGPSHVLKATGLSDDEAYASIRFSLGRFNTKEEIDRATALVVSSVRKLRSLRITTAPRNPAFPS
jgi:cysteine desulfurase